MGCAPPKSEGGEWKHWVNAASVALHKCVLTLELKSALGNIKSILLKKTPNFQLILKLDFFDKKFFYGFEVFLFCFVFFL